MREKAREREREKALPPKEMDSHQYDASQVFFEHTHSERCVHRNSGCTGRQVSTLSNRWRSTPLPAVQMVDDKEKREEEIDQSVNVAAAE
mgnify:CR=1 FL=1